MKFAEQDRYGQAVINSLRIYGPMTVREIAAAIGLSVNGTDHAIRRMMCRGQVERTGERKGVGSGCANIYRWVDIEEEDNELMINEVARLRAIEAAETFVRVLRSGYMPGMFDPFRVLRAQVGA